MRYSLLCTVLLAPFLATGPVRAQDRPLPTTFATQAGPGGLADGASATASTEVLNAAGDLIGGAQLRELSAGVLLSMDATILKPDRYVVSLNSAGKCGAPDFVAAGPTWARAGKLPLLVISPIALFGRIERYLPGLKLADMLDADGISLVVHAVVPNDPSLAEGTGFARAGIGQGLVTAKPSMAADNGTRLGCGVFIRDGNPSK